MIRAADVSRMLAQSAERFASELLPNGKRRGAEWMAGSVGGEAGESLKVHLTGAKAGVWSDFSTGESGDLLDLWAAVRNLDMRAALADAKDSLGVVERKVENPPKAYQRPSKEGVTPLLPQHGQWLQSRKITERTASKFKLASHKGALMFPYLRGGELIAAKYRGVPEKKFWASADTEPCLFGWHVLSGREREIVLVEGEMDALAMWEYGITAMSVPFGGGKDGKQQWIESEFERMAQFDRITLALDNDAAGQAATADIVKRLGRERCYVATLPRKDANECLMAGVPLKDMLDAINNAKTEDPDCLKSAADFEDDLVSAFANAGQPEHGIRLPWKKVADRLVLRMGEVSMWAGINGHGKSQVIGHITAHALRDWRACVASMEFKPVKWLRRMTRQVCGMSQPTAAFVRHVSHWYRDKLWVFEATGNAKASEILEVFAYAARRYGIELFIIDNLAKCGFAEDDYNGQKRFVDQLTDFARDMDVHVALVAHMRKTQDEDKAAGKMDVKGSGGMTDMSDTLVSVWRNKPKERVARKPENERTEKDAEKLAEPDCVLTCAKQRNGEDEPVIGLWFDPDSLQFLAGPEHKPLGMVPFSSMERAA